MYVNMYVIIYKSIKLFAVPQWSHGAVTEQIIAKVTATL